MCAGQPMNDRQPAPRLLLGACGLASGQVWERCAHWLAHVQFKGQVLLPSAYCLLVCLPAAPCQVLTLCSRLSASLPPCPADLRLPCLRVQASCDWRGRCSSSATCCTSECSASEGSCCCRNCFCCIQLLVLSMYFGGGATGPFTPCLTVFLKCLPCLAPNPPALQHGGRGGQLEGSVGCCVCSGPGSATGG